MKDTAGRELTKEQQEFYADSKILDKDGNLLVLYHGTGADFTVFDIKRAGQNYDEWSEYGKGIYLTPSTKLAQYYAENAISELDGLTDVQRAYLWQDTNKGWNEKKNPWK